MCGRKDANLRKFRETDVGRLRRLIFDTIDASYSRVYPPRSVQFFKEFHAEHRIIERSRTGTILVLEENGQLVATGSIVDSEILAVFVHPKFQHGGRGKALMRELEEEARHRGVRESELSVSLPSKRFYEGLGYEMVEEKSKDVGEGQRLDFWKARKFLLPIQN
jgi:putative acetyltransferase